MPIRINLTEDEMLMAAQQATLRILQCKRDGKRHRYGAKETETWQMGIEGAMGEIVIAKHFGIFWGKGTYGSDDVGPYEVRQTPLDHGSLIVHPTDKDEKRYYLVTGILGNYVIRGYMFARDAKQPKYWNDPTGKGRPAYFVPQSDLIDEFVTTQ
jgi:hypothetical protein